MPVGAEAFVQPPESRRVLALVDGIPAFSVVPVGPHTLPQLAVVDGDHAALPARGHDLVLTEGPTTDIELQGVPIMPSDINVADALPLGHTCWNSSWKLTQYHGKTLLSVHERLADRSSDEERIALTPICD